MMKKIISIICLVLIVSPIFIPSIKVEAKTLRQAYAELSALETTAQQNTQQRKLTEKEIATTRSEITVIYREINQINIDTANLEKEIKQLDTEIKTKDKEIKELSKYLQVSSGESVYLEYAFGSETLTEFVYRLAVIQELNAYNSTLILSMQDNIKQNEQKTMELAAKQKLLSSKEKEYVSKLALLGETKEELEEAYSSIEEDIANSKALLSYYERAGCKLDDQLDVCASRLVYNTNYKRPLASGRVTSGFGPRSLFGSSFHYGMDFGVVVGTRLYPVANGIVTSVTGSNSKSTCGGLTLTIVYNIRGNYYTSVYMHLSQVFVRIGEVVGVDQIVAHTGNSGYCTTGPHLHFTMTNKARYVSAGLYGVPGAQTYTSYDDYKRYAFNQRAMFGFGLAGSSFYSRNV